MDEDGLPTFTKNVGNSSLGTVIILYFRMKQLPVFTSLMKNCYNFAIV